MRTLIALAVAALVGVGAAQATESSQVAAKEPAATARTEPMTRKEAREMGRDFLKANKVRQGRVGDVKEIDGTYEVELLSADGIRLKTLKIDAATGQIEG